MSFERTTLGEALIDAINFGVHPARFRSNPFASERLRWRELLHPDNSEVAEINTQARGFALIFSEDSREFEHDFHIHGSQNNPLNERAWCAALACSKLLRVLAGSPRGITGTEVIVDYAPSLVADKGAHVLKIRDERIEQELPGYEAGIGLETWWHNPDQGLYVRTMWPNIVSEERGRRLAEDFGPRAEHARADELQVHQCLAVFE